MEKDRFSLTLATAALVLSLTWLVIYLWKKNRKLPPGPWGLPLVGYYLFLTSSPPVQFANLAKKYGDVFSFRTVGGHLIVVLNGAKMIKEVLVNRSDEVIGRPIGSNLVAWATDGLGITQEEGAPWREQRRFFLQTAKTLGFGKMEMEGLVQEKTRQLLQDFRNGNGLSAQEFKLLVANAAGNVSSELLLSTKFEKDDPTFQQIIDGLADMLKIFMGNMNYLVGPWFDLSLWFVSDMRKIRRGKESVLKATNAIIEKHAHSFDPDNPKDLIDEFLKRMNDENSNVKSGKSSFTKERLQAAVVNILIDGVESISAAICVHLQKLSKYPNIQSLVQRELDSVIGHERLPSWVDRQNLPFYEAVLQELWRCEAPFQVTTQYSNFEDMEINGYRIPKRSILVANLWTIHNDPVTFPNPEKFDPGRFLDADGKKIKREGPYPFGLGKRACVGESLAQMVVFLVIAAILQHFKITTSAINESINIVPRE